MNERGVILMDFLKSVSPIQLVIFSIVIALIIIAESESDELAVISNVFAGIGGLIAIFAVQRDFLGGKKEELLRDDFIKRQIALLEEHRKH